MGTLLLIAAALLVWTITQPVLTSEPVFQRPRSARAEALRADVLALVNDHFPRDHRHPENLAAAADFIAASLAQSGARVGRQSFALEGLADGDYQNVIASLGPSEGPRVIVGAHYDAYGELPAADDNASGVAILLETARLLGETQTLPLRIDLVAFVLEEPPHFRSANMGSRVHAASLQAEGVAVAGVVVLNTIGYFVDEPGTQQLPTALLRPFYPGHGHFLAIAGELDDIALVRRVKRSLNAGMAMPAYSFTAPRSVPGVDFSDHQSYWQHGYRAVLLSDTAFYRNAAYHTAQDTPDRLNYAAMADVVHGLYQVILRLASGDD
ncbi:MAG: M28 family peptidase [Xanthomonadales bacterium]|nr:M28 family peptidase [Xanthomonadales bacterium]